MRTAAVYRRSAAPTKAAGDLERAISPAAAFSL
jgi:hypothetical protein